MSTRLVLVHDATPHPEPAIPMRRHRIPRVAATVALVALSLVGLLSRCYSERTAVRQLPKDERRALLGRTLEDLTRVCQPAADGLRDWCRAQSELVLEIPECGASCKSLAARQLTRVPAPR